MIFVSLWAQKPGSLRDKWNILSTFCCHHLRISYHPASLNCCNCLLTTESSIVPSNPFFTQLPKKKKNTYFKHKMDQSATPLKIFSLASHLPRVNLNSFWPVRPACFHEQPHMVSSVPLQQRCSRTLGVCTDPSLFWSPPPPGFHASGTSPSGLYTSVTFLVQSFLATPHKLVPAFHHCYYLLRYSGGFFGHLMEELTHLKRLWCWERSKAGGERGDRGWDGWMASLTWWTWVWASSRSWWWIGKPGNLQFMGSQRVRYDWATELRLFLCHTYPVLWLSIFLPSYLLYEGKGLAYFTKPTNASVPTLVPEPSRPSVIFEGWMDGWTLVQSNIIQ